jgi:hypothetical protein
MEENMKAKDFDILGNIIENDATYRGGCIKWDISSMGWDIPEGERAVMGTSQNYLGGGMAAAIENGYMFNAKALPDDQFAELQILKERMKRYHYSYNLGGGDEWMAENNSFEKQQNLPARSEYLK